MKIEILSLLAVALLAIDAEPVHGRQTETEDSGEFRVSVAYFDPFGSEETTAVELAYVAERWGVWRTKLQVGGTANLEGAVYGYGGLVLPVDLPGNLRLNASFGAGAYRPGGSLDLGGVVQFRSGVQLDIVIGGSDRLALFLYHLSNAGLTSRNPGAEVLGLGYIIHW